MTETERKLLYASLKLSELGYFECQECYRWFEKNDMADSNLLGLFYCKQCADTLIEEERMEGKL